MLDDKEKLEMDETMYDFLAEETEKSLEVEF